MGFLDTLKSIGKKADGWATKGFKIGDKVVDRVATINSKVGSSAHALEGLSFLPSSVRGAIKKVEQVSNKVGEGTQLARRGIEEGRSIQKGVKNVKSVEDAIKLSGKLYDDGKSAYKTTRKFIERPLGKYGVSGAQKVLQPNVPKTTRKVKRVTKDTISTIGRGIGHSLLSSMGPVGALADAGIRFFG